MNYDGLGTTMRAFDVGIPMRDKDNNDETKNVIIITNNSSDADAGRCLKVEFIACGKSKTIIPYLPVKAAFLLAKGRCVQTRTHLLRPKPSNMAAELGS